MVVATDVTNPLLGPAGAARVFAPQKGATPEQVDVLEDALTRFAAVVLRATGVDVASLPGKVTGRLRALAAAESKRCVVFAGSSEIEGPDVRSLTELEPDVEVSCREAARLLEEVSRQWAEGE